MDFHFAMYEAKEGAAADARFVCLPYLPGGTELMPIPFTAATEEQAKACALEFIRDEFLPSARNRAGRIQ